MFSSNETKFDAIQFKQTLRIVNKFEKVIIQRDKYNQRLLCCLNVTNVEGCLKSSSNIFIPLGTMIGRKEHTFIVEGGGFEKCIIPFLFEGQRKNSNAV